LQELNYRIEVARNRTRGLKGRAKVTAFANELDLSFDQVVQLTEKIRVERLKGRGNGSEGEKIVKELVDMLYVMSKRGESIEPLVQNMTLLPAQRILLQGAALPPEKEAQLIVDYLSKLDTVTTEDYELALFYLPSLGVISTDVMIRRLEQMKESPSRWGRHGYVTLFRALSLSGDARALTLLKHFEKSNDRSIRGYAILSRNHLEHLGKWSSHSSPSPPTTGPVFQ
jgi:hypothetical protein